MRDRAAKAGGKKPTAKAGHEHHADLQTHARQRAHQHHGRAGEKQEEHDRALLTDAGW